MRTRQAILASVLLASALLVLAAPGPARAESAPPSHAESSVAIEGAPCRRVSDVQNALVCSGGLVCRENRCVQEESPPPRPLPGARTSGYAPHSRGTLLRQSNISTARSHGRAPSYRPSGHSSKGTPPSVPTPPGSSSPAPGGAMASVSGQVWPQAMVPPRPAWRSSRNPSEGPPFWPAGACGQVTRIGMASTLRPCSTGASFAFRGARWPFWCQSPPWDPAGVGVMTWP
jgi:hypothetical protein